MIRAVATTVLLAAAAIAGLRFVNMLATVDVKTVRLDGDLTQAEGQEVQEAVTGALTQPGIGTATDVVGAVQRLGWVRDVQVRRLWPDVLHVSVQRQTLAARWGDADHSYLTTGGDIVPLPADDRDPMLRQLPVLKAQHASSAEAMRLNTLLNEIAGAENLRLHRLEQDDAGHWTATLASGLPVVLGASDLGGRFGRFLVVYRQVLRYEIADVERVDARYKTGVAVRWKEAEQPDGVVADASDTVGPGVS